MNALFVAVTAVALASFAGAAPAAADVLAPPPGWVALDKGTVPIGPGSRVLAVWRAPATHVLGTHPSINVIYQPFEGTLQVFGQESTVQIGRRIGGALIELAGTTTTCGSYPAYRISWSAPWSTGSVLHFDQLAIKTLRGVEIATYTRDVRVAPDPSALTAINSMCHPVESALTPGGASSPGTVWERQST